MVRDIGEWRPGFYTEFRCASHEHSGLPWGAILGKVIQNKEIHSLKMGMFQNYRNRNFSGEKAPQGATRYRGAFQID